MAVRKTEKEMSGSSRKVRESRAVKMAKKRQASSQNKIKRDYSKSVERSKKRTYDIQTPEVQARMKQNQSEIMSREKARKKKIRHTTKKAGNKYR